MGPPVIDVQTCASVHYVALMCKVWCVVYCTKQGLVLHFFANMLVLQGMSFWHGMCLMRGIHVECNAMTRST